MNNATNVISEQQVFRSIAGAHVSSELSEAIDRAEDLNRRGAGEQSVVRTKNGNIEVFSEFTMVVRTRDVVESLYVAPHGFIFPMSA